MRVRQEPGAQFQELPRASCAPHGVCGPGAFGRQPRRWGPDKAKHSNKEAGVGRSLRRQSLREASGLWGAFAFALAISAK
jgi:hypothetical protein